MSFSAGIQTALVTALRPDNAFLPLKDNLKMLPRVLSKSQKCFSVGWSCLERRKKL